MTILQTQFVVDAKGRKRHVLFPLKRYQKFMEDLHDLAKVADRCHEKGVSLAVIKRRFQKSGPLSPADSKK